MKECDRCGRDLPESGRCDFCSEIIEEEIACWDYADRYEEGRQMGEEDA